MRALHNSRWFERRPCFWAALAGAGAAWLTYRHSIPLAAWAILAAAGCGAALLSRRATGALLAVASVYGALAVMALGPSADHVRPGTPITVRGSVESARPAGDEHTRIVLRGLTRRVGGGWMWDQSRYGAIVPGTCRAGDLAEVSGRVELPLPATNPGDFDARLSWLRYGVQTLIHVRPGGYMHLGVAERSAWQRFATGLRQRVLDANRRTLSPEAAVIANNFLIGDDAAADREATDRVRTAFRESGTLHLLVVSGTQVSLVAGLFLWLGWRLWRLRYFFWMLAVGALVLFHGVTDGDASVSRAAVMGAALIGGLVAARKPDGENCLGIAALALLALNPFAMLDVGAQLSFAAVWGLVRVAPAIARVLGPPESGVPEAAESLPRAYWQLGARILAACAAAHLATAPILAFHFQTASWSAIAANLCIALLAAGFIYVVIAHVALACVGLPVLAWLTELGASSLSGWAGFFGTAPLGVQGVFPPPIWLLAISFGMLLCAGRHGANRATVFGTLAGLSGMLFLSERLPALPPTVPTVRAIDIGQGDAVLLQGTDGSSVLCDAGPPGAGRALVRSLRGLRIGRPDALVVSHAHADHVGGFRALCEAAPPRVLIHPTGIEESEGWAEVASTAAEFGVPLFPATAGDRVRIRKSSLAILGPLVDAPATENEESLVARWDADGARVLLTGDIGMESERQLLRWGAEVRADLLKVAHHGSNGSSAPELLKAVEPRCAVISCGRNNRFGHPGEEALARIEASGVPIARTDLGGMVTVRLEKDGPVVEQFLQERR